MRNEPQATPDGTADYGFEKPLVEGFRKEYGLDPLKLPNNDALWVKFRAEPRTLFMGDAYRLIKNKSRSLPISAMVHHPWSYRGATPRINGSYYGLLLDLETWAKEHLIDEIVAVGYYIKGGTPKKAYAYLKEQVKNHCPIWLYWWTPPDVREFRKSLRTAEKLGAPQILYWESDYLDLPDRSASVRELTEAMAEYARE